MGTHSALAPKAGEPLLDVGGILGSALLAVVHHVDAGVLLAVEDVAHGVADAGVERGLIEALLVLAQPQQVLEIGRPGQTAGVGGENPGLAAFHGPSVNAVMMGAIVMQGRDRRLSCTLSTYLTAKLAEHL